MREITIKYVFLFKLSDFFKKINFYHIFYNIKDDVQVYCGNSLIYPIVTIYPKKHIFKFIFKNHYIRKKGII